MTPRAAPPGPRDHFQPVRRKLDSDSSDPHFMGPIVVELAPDGIRWWWDGADGDAEGHFTPADLVHNAFIQREADLEQAISHARTYLEQAAKLVERLQKFTAFKVIV